MTRAAETVDLFTCPNCFSAYADVQDVCPACEADRDGSGGRLELDTTARGAVARLGGLYGGILEAGPGLHVLWCARGVCVVSAEVGLVWRRETRTRVEDVRLLPGAVLVAAGGGERRLRLADGVEVEDRPGQDRGARRRED